MAKTTKTEQKTQSWVSSGPKRRAPSAPPPIPRVDELITKVVAIDLVARDVKSADDTLRETRDKVRKRIDKAILDGDLQLSPKGLLSYGRVVAWARSRTWKSPTLLARRPAASEELVDSDVVIATETVTAFAVPEDPHARQAALTAALERNLELERQKADLEADLAAVRPLAERYVANVATRRRPAGKKRPGR